MALARSSRPSGCGSTAGPSSSGAPTISTNSYPGLRLLSGSKISFPDAGFEITCTPLLANFLAVGTGYGLEEDWRHGMYQGPETVTQGLRYAVEEIQTLGSYAVVDQAGRFEYDGHVGYGLYEHAFSGAMPKYGLT